MNTVNKLPFNVIIFDTNDAPTSRCMFPTEREARKRYKKAIVSAECANVGRIQLTYFSFPITNVLAEWVAFKESEKSDVQTAGYIVHSARALDGGSPASLGSKLFHHNVGDAVRQARKLADEWHLGHEGLIVFKAVRHVKKVKYTPQSGTRIEVCDV